MILHNYFGSNMTFKMDTDIRVSKEVNHKEL